MSRARRSNQLRRQRNSKARGTPHTDAIRTHNLVRITQGNLRTSRRRRRMMTKRAPSSRGGNNPRHTLTNNRRKATLVRRSRRTRSLNSKTRLQKMRHMRRRQDKNRADYKQRRRTHTRRVIPLNTFLRSRHRTGTRRRRRGHSSRNMFGYRRRQLSRRFVFRGLSRVLERVPAAIATRRQPTKANRSSRRRS